MAQKKSLMQKAIDAAKKVVAKPITPKKAAKKVVAKPITPKNPGGLKKFNSYKPKANESYMNKSQIKHFVKILNDWKLELSSDIDRTVSHMQDELTAYADPNDRASQESDMALELRNRDRERKLIRKIQSSLIKIDDGTFGYCEETGEQIGLQRLEARPVASLTLEAQERREITERQFNDNR